ncbi:hypothetical protein D9Q98_009142 [Chlorella vulgaris]|uniref:Uncharacterized protein n=1 Tax=Chlorella vulgaris TaxID=3077 RepID=A0A9D4YTJ0_CHLVU|nr:hypothetical protein D9Q98_009142 [Chlorella vulgaris]
MLCIREDVEEDGAQSARMTLEDAEDEVAWLRHQMVNKSQQQHELEGELRDMHKQVHGKREQLRDKREQLAAATTAGQVKDEAHARLWKQNADDQQRECAAKDEQQHVLEGEVRDLHEQMRGNLVQWEAAATAGQVKDEAHARLWKQNADDQQRECAAKDEQQHVLEGEVRDLHEQMRGNLVQWEAAATAGQVKDEAHARLWKQNADDQQRECAAKDEQQHVLEGEVRDLHEQMRGNLVQWEAAATAGQVKDEAHARLWKQNADDQQRECAAKDEQQHVLEGEVRDLHEQMRGNLVQWEAAATAGQNADDQQRECAAKDEQQHVLEGEVRDLHEQMRGNLVQWEAAATAGQVKDEAHARLWKQNADDQQRECAAKDEQQHVLEGEVRDLHEQMRGNLVQWEAAATAGQVKDEAHARLWKQNADDQQRECAAKDEQQHVLEGEVRDLHEQMRGNLVQWEAAATAGQVKDEAHARLWKQNAVDQQRECAAKDAALSGLQAEVTATSVDRRSMDGLVAEQVQELHNRIRWLEVSLQASMAREEVLQGQLAAGGPATRSKSIAVAAVLGAA